MMGNRESERLARIEENLKYVKADIEEIKQVQKEQFNELEKRMGSLLKNIVADIPNREWIEGLDRRLKDIEIWKATTKASVKAYLAVGSVVGGIMTILFNFILERFIR